MKRAAAVSLAAALLTVPAHGGGCAAVRRAGAWTVTSPPQKALPDTGSLRASPLLLEPGGPPGSVLMSYDGAVLRSDDGMCTWQTAYSLDPLTVAGKTGQPYAALAAADPDIAIDAVATRLVSRASDPRTTYVLMSPWTVGLLDSFGESPFLLATTGDEHAWRTDQMRNGSDAIFGSSYSARVLPAPSDPRVAYAFIGYGHVYVTRDGGATWAYLMDHPQGGAVVVDPLDAGLLYVVSGTKVQAVTTRGPVSARTLLTVAGGLSITGLDVVHRPGGAATIVATVVGYTVSPLSYELYRSVDAGRKWTALHPPVPPSTFAYTLGPGALVTRSGDLLLVVAGAPFGKNMTLLMRWRATTRTWAKSEQVRLPAGDDVHVSWFDAADLARRTFVYIASSTSSLPLIGTYSVP